MIFYSDFETDEDELGAYVWSACTITDSGKIFELYSIQSYIDLLLRYRPEECYFFNLKFDGSYIINELLDRGFKQAYDNQMFYKNRDMPNKTFKYLISDMGVWYMIVIKYKGGIITIYDAMKLAPMSLRKAGEAFETKHKKLEMDFNTHYPRGYRPNREERDYIINDCHVLKEVMEAIRSHGMEKMTVGSCCLAQYKKIFNEEHGAYTWDELFPNCYKMEFTKENVSRETFDKFPSLGEFIQYSYHGAFVYTNPHKKGKIIKNGKTLDVNSLYVYVMHSSSGFKYPTGKPLYFKGDNYTINDNQIHFIHFKCRFYLKDGFLPFIHIRQNPLYKPTQTLKTSDVYYNGEYHKFIEKDGELLDTKCEFIMNEYEFEIFRKHYDLEELEIIDGFKFFSQIGLFDKYIDYWMNIKEHSSGAKRTIAKQYLVNLYGKFAMSPESSFKHILDDNSNGLKFEIIKEYDKKPGYNPVGSCVTSFAMIYTLTHAQKCYHEDKPGFCYSDTDSIHFDGPVPEYFEIHGTKLGAWKLENEWDEGLFQGSKCYIERTGDKYNITCAGLPQRGKDLFSKSCGQEIELKHLNEEEVKFLEEKRTMSDFKPGVKIPGKLLPIQIKGGMVLRDAFFTFKERIQ